MAEFDIYAELIKKTNFTIASEGSLMHSRSKVKTPSAVLNCLYGGGIPLGIMCEVSGVSTAGKSTFLYQCMANFQKDYPNGVCAVMDMETSFDINRLEALGVNTKKVLRLGATNIEDAFANLFNLLNRVEELAKTHQGVVVFVIYDSITSGGTESEQQAASEGKSAFGAGTMREDTRALKHNLNVLMRYFELFPFFIGFINQVMVKPTTFGPAKVESGGGNALKHLSHTHIVFNNPKDEYDGNFILGTSSKMELHKSKLSPKMINIPCYIDVTKGGLIDEVESFTRYLTDPKVALIVADKWYTFSDYLKSDMLLKYPVLAKNEELKTILGKSYRKEPMYDLISNNEDLFYLLQIALIDFIDRVYTAQRAVNADYQKELMSECKYFQD